MAHAHAHTHTHARAREPSGVLCMTSVLMDGGSGSRPSGCVRDIGSERLSGVMTGAFCSVAGPAELKASSLKAGKSLVFLPAPTC